MSLYDYWRFVRRLVQTGARGMEKVYKSDIKPAASIVKKSKRITIERLG